MEAIKHNLLLADDDIDDCIFFKEALEELPLISTLTTVNDGVELMDHLNATPDNLPDILFLDLNMPRKTGLDCLSEIRLSNKFKDLTIIILSTSYDHTVMKSLYEKGAKYYIRKPAEFSKLKKVIHEAISLSSAPFQKQLPVDRFVLNSS